MFIFDRCCRSSAAVTPVKYECDANDITGTFARSKILLTEKLTNGALVTPIPGVPTTQVARNKGYKQRVLMHGHQGWNVRHGLCHIYMIYVYIWVVYSFRLFCCLFIIVSTQFVALYKPCKPKPKPSTYAWQRSKDRYLDRSQSNKYAINMQIQTISVSK